jgi:hypothetical protein
VFSTDRSRQGLTEPIRVSVSAHRSRTDWNRRTVAAKDRNRNAGQGTSNPAAILVKKSGVYTHNRLLVKWRCYASYDYCHDEAMADFRSRGSRGAYRLPQHPLRRYGSEPGNLFDHDHQRVAINSLSSDLFDLVGMVVRSHPKCTSLWRAGIRHSYVAKCQTENVSQSVMSVIAMLRQLTGGAIYSEFL